MTKQELLDQLVGVPGDIEVEFSDGLPLCSVTLVTSQRGPELLVLSDTDPDEDSQLDLLLRTLRAYLTLRTELEPLSEEYDGYRALIDRAYDLEQRLTILTERMGS